MQQTVTVKAPCKINLFLNIKEKLETGYHNMDMVMQSLSYSDTIIIKKRNDNKGIKVLSQSCCVPKDKSSIIYRCADAFFSNTGIVHDDITIEVINRIPHEAGLGGGSADGAGVLVGLNKLYGLNLTKKKLCEIGVTVGADIPFCIMGGTARVFGIGDKIEAINSNMDYFAVVAKPSSLSVKTPDAFNIFDNSSVKSSETSGSMIDAIKNGNTKLMSKLCYNAFSPVLCIDQCCEIEKILAQFGSLGGCMTGSGSAVFGIFTDIKSANNAITSLKNKEYICFLARPVSYGAIIL
ncbi:MAG: 4-(cytidine 5'-diphospho)-2-C-methyl-D-erythritol kinase [Oscillospiraceae bacterium]